MPEIKRYTPEHKAEWNDFVARSKNGTFLFDRGYMDYHADRFEDFSLMFYDEKGALLALLPANRDGSALQSHGGLTFGGLVMSARCKAEAVCGIFASLKAYAREQGISLLTYKPVPHIYHRQPAEEDLYALFKECTASLVGRNISSTIQTADPIAWRYSRKYEANKARKAGITVGESDDMPGFWLILKENLRQRYGAKPVHSLTDIMLLQGRFPGNIRLFAAWQDDRMVAGVIVFIHPTVVHTQYISASEEGKAVGALDLIFSHLLHERFRSHRYFDFGTSNADGGRTLCTSLIHQKEGFGGRAVCYDTYEIDLTLC